MEKQDQVIDWKQKWKQLKKRVGDELTMLGTRIAKEHELGLEAVEDSDRIKRYCHKKTMKWMHGLEEEEQLQ